MGLGNANTAAPTRHVVFSPQSSAITVKGVLHWRSLHCYLGVAQDDSALFLPRRDEEVYLLLKKGPFQEVTKLLSKDTELIEALRNILNEKGSIT